MGVERVGEIEKLREMILVIEAQVEALLAELALRGPGRRDLNVWAN